MRLQKLCAHKRTVCLAYCVRLSWQCVSLVAVFFSFGGGISAATQTDGEILASKPNASLPVFDSLDEFSRNYFPKAMYEEARSQADFDILEIAYASDGLHRPRNTHQAEECRRKKVACDYLQSRRYRGLQPYCR